MHRVQEQELFFDEEQEKHDGQDSAEEVLPELYETYDAQGNKGVTAAHMLLMSEGLDRTAEKGYEHLSDKGQ